jgi:hypothetical protein
MEIPAAGVLETSFRASGDPPGPDRRSFSQRQSRGKYKDSRESSPRTVSVELDELRRPAGHLDRLVDA